MSVSSSTPEKGRPASEGNKFWQTGNPEWLQALKAEPGGLSSAEAAARLTRDGPNIAVADTPRRLLGKFLRRLGEPLTAILLVAAVVSGATGDWQSFVVIAVIVLFSVILDIVQEHRAELAVDALKRSVAVTVTIRRDGQTVELPVREVVVGDVVELKVGDLVPADGVVLEAHNALANEATMTGEPYPAEKRPGPAAGPGPTDAFNALFSGTSLVGGQASMLVVATGSATRFGAIAASLQQQAMATAFERGVHALGMLILRLTGFLVLLVLLIQLVRHGLTLESFLFAVALAVGLTPELLPMVMTVTLSRGAMRMAKRKVVVKRLSAIDDLGAMDVLCTDKTGTLTEAKIALVGGLDPKGGASTRVVELASRNSRFATAMRNNLDEALLAATGAATDDWQLADDLPFDFERRMSSVLVARAGELLMITKGAPEAILALCGHVEQPDGSQLLLNAARRRKIAALMDAQERQGFRLLGVASKPMPAATTGLVPGDEADLSFCGYVVFVDPPKASATAAIGRLAAAGVRLKIISGDAAPVVQHLVETLGLPAKGILTGEQIARMGDAGLAAHVVATDLFVRVSPDQKSRIVRALMRRGHTVGFLGDGINDAPAIHAADVGISVEGGTEVAREAADIVLLAPDLEVLAEGVAEGRRTYANIMKYVRMGTSSNFGNMLSMALASMFLPFLPLSPLQILLNNLIYDISEIGIPFDSADSEDLARPRNWSMPDVLRFTLIMGPLSSVFDAATFVMLRLAFHAEVEVFRTAWFVESITTQILVIFLIRSAKPFWRSRPDRVLVTTSLGGLAVALAFALTPMGHVLGFAPLPAPILLAIIGISIAYLGCAEALKGAAMRPGRIASGRRTRHRGWTFRL
ncbi:MAG: magnesium-translocating P-type ATPase [Devosia sp.]|nr:magnesium-translocating P-type ATPase [Devosia sp.]